MRITLESTTKIVELEVNGHRMPARVWEGTTASGVACHAFVTRIAVLADDDITEFARDLQEHRPPTNPDITVLPARLVL